MNVERTMIEASAFAFARRAAAMRAKAAELSYIVTDARDRDLCIWPSDAVVMLGTAQLLADIADDLRAMLPPGPPRTPDAPTPVVTPPAPVGGAPAAAMVPA